MTKADIVNEITKIPGLTKPRYLQPLKRSWTL